MAIKTRITIESWNTKKPDEIESASTENVLTPSTKDDELKEAIVDTLLGYGLESARTYLFGIK